MVWLSIHDLISVSLDQTTCQRPSRFSYESVSHYLPGCDWQDWV